MAKTRKKAGKKLPGLILREEHLRMIEVCTMAPDDARRSMDHAMLKGSSLFVTQGEIALSVPLKGSPLDRPAFIHRETAYLLRQDLEEGSMVRVYRDAKGLLVAAIGSERRVLDDPALAHVPVDSTIEERPLPGDVWSHTFKLGARVAGKMAVAAKLVGAFSIRFTAPSDVEKMFGFEMITKGSHEEEPRVLAAGVAMPVGDVEEEEAEDEDRED